MAKGTTVKMWRRTIGVLAGLLILGFGAILFSLVRLQLIDGQELQRAAVDQQLKDTNITALRGTIYDANMKELAKSATVWRVVLEPKYIESEGQRQAVANGLAPILEMDAQEIYTIIADNPNSYYQVVKSQVETDVRDQILVLREELADKDKYGEDVVTAGIRLEEDYKRYYPYGTLASTVLGFTNTDGQGIEGLEYQYNEYLTGTAGRLVTAKNAIGTDMPFQYEQMVDAQNGYNLVLNIDQRIQHILEKYLDEGVANNEVANRATGIIMNVKTGAILALAVSGDYDPNDPWTITDTQALEEIEKLTDEKEKQEATLDALYTQWRNKAVSDTYYPGSVFKMVTASMALEENIVNESTPFHCSGSIVPVEGERAINCWRLAGHGDQTFTDAVCNSCNPVFVQVGLELGPETFYNYFKAFGLTERTGIDLPGEQVGQIRASDTMNKVDLAVYAFGQNFTITPIQMITACAAVANGGYLVEPQVVSKIIDDDGNIIESFDTTVKRQVISKETSERISKILNLNATTGTAKNGYVAGYQICGKTGTSEKVAKFYEEGGPGKATMQYIASYCGFAPVDDPEIAMLIFFDEPQGSNYYGGSVAGPVFAKIMSEVLPYLGIEPKYTQEELSQLDGVAPDVVTHDVEQAQTEVENAGFDAIVYGDGDTVLSQIPEPGGTIPQGGNVVLFTDEESTQETTTVPDLIGLSPSQANQRAGLYNLQISITGAALNSNATISSSQSIEEGTQVPPGTVISVNFIEADQVA